MVAPGATGGRADHLSRPVNSRGRSLIWTHFCSSRSASNRHQPESSDGRLFDRTNRRIRPAIPDQWLRSYNTMQAPMTAEPTSTPSTANAVRIEDITVRIPESERREPNHGWRGTQLPSPERPMLHGVSNTVRVSGRSARSTAGLVGVVSAGEEWSRATGFARDFVRLVRAVFARNGVGSWPAVVFGGVPDEVLRAHRRVRHGAALRLVSDPAKAITTPALHPEVPARAGPISAATTRGNLPRAAAIEFCGDFVTTSAGPPHTLHGWSGSRWT